MRIALGGIAHETNTFSTLPTEYDDFVRIEGEALIESVIPEGFDRADVVLLPLFSAHATPGGPTRRAAFDVLLAELASRLEASLPLDGVLLILHGAMEVEGEVDGEQAILERARGIVGPDVFVAVTLDLHANLSHEVVRRSDLIVAYRTAPHRDVRRTHARGLELMVECLRRGLRPVTKLIKLPLLVPGEAAVTEVEPAKGLYALLEESDAKPLILCASILIGCAWTDSPHDSVGVVVTGADRSEVESEAGYLAERVWEARGRFAIDSEVASLEEAIDLAIAGEARPVFISDSGDNTTAGAAGDLPIVLDYLLRRGVEGALVAGIADATAAMRAAAAGAGARVTLEIGGKLDRTHAAPFAAKAEVVHVGDFTGFAPRSGVAALVRIGSVDLVLQSDRRPFTSPEEFTRIGIDPGAYRIVVVKEGYLFPGLRDYGPRHIMALTEGFADQRIDRLPYRRLSRPIYPLDRETTWSGMG